MDQTFGLYRQHRATALILSVFWATAAVFSAQAFFAHKPGAGGCVAIFGSMLLVSVVLLVSACVGLLTISKSLVTITCVLRTRRFDVSKTERLRWGRRGKIVLQGNAKSITIELYAASRSDRLQIIRFLRAVVPKEKQEGWPLFCHRIALALRDGVTAKQRERSFDGNTSPRAELLITRKRYDRLFILLFPITLTISLVIWGVTGFYQFVVVPGGIAFWYPFVRYHVPREGMRVDRMKDDPVGKWALVGGGVIIAAIAMMLCAPYSRKWTDIGQWAACGIALAWFPPFFYAVLKEDRRRKRNESLAAPHSLEQWNAGELK